MHCYDMKGKFDTIAMVTMDTLVMSPPPGKTARISERKEVIAFQKKKKKKQCSPSGCGAPLVISSFALSKMLTSAYPVVSHG